MRFVSFYTPSCNLVLADDTTNKNRFSESFGCALLSSYVFSKNFIRCDHANKRDTEARARDMKS